MTTKAEKAKANDPGKCGAGWHLGLLLHREHVGVTGYAYGPVMIE